MNKYFRLLVLLAVFVLLDGCAPLPDTIHQVESTLFVPATRTQLVSPTRGYRFTPTTAITEISTPTLSTEDHECSTVEQLPIDSAEAQQILEEFIANYKEEVPTEYMGMAVLHRVDRVREWAVITGSIAGEGKDIIVVRQTSQGYQIAEFTHVAPLESPEELELRVIQPLLEKLPEAPEVLFTCLDQSWLLAVGYPGAPASVFQLAYIGTDDFTPEGVTEIHTLRSDGSGQIVLLHEPMLITGLASAPDGERIAFWGCPGSLANDCLPGEDLDVWVVNWDGSNRVNLTGDSTQDDSHPDWSPDGTRIVFDSWRSGKAEIYIMQADGSGVQQLSQGVEDNREPKWSPDGKWIAYQCNQAGETHICVVSPDGQPAGEPISGTTPEWSPAGLEGDVRLAYLCFQEGQSDICTVRPDGLDIVKLTDSSADEHSIAWSPDGSWIAFVSNRGDDIDIYKTCATCPGDLVSVRLTDEVRSAMWPAWSPDGRQLTYTDEPGGTLTLVNSDRSGVTYLSGGVFGPPIWRP